MFKLQLTDGDARVGQLITRSGAIATPFFMPVITRGQSNRVIGPPEYHRLGISSADCRDAAAGVALSNGLISAFAPGIAPIVAEGGLARWLGTDSILFADSGGYQVSNGNSFVVRQTKDGYHFRARWSGDELDLTPEKSVELQHQIGIDVAMVLDDLPPFGCDRRTLLDSVDRTHMWAERALRRREDSEQLMFGICQGGVDAEIRARSAAFIDSLHFDGTAIGGIAVIRNHADRLTAVSAAIGALRRDKPRYVMGIGNPSDIVRLAGLGVDCFDGAYPSIQGRLGNVLTDDGPVKYRDWLQSVESGSATICTCVSCARTPLAELHDQSEPLLSKTVNALALHNTVYLVNLIARLRIAIRRREYASFAQQFCTRWEAFEKAH